MKKFINWYYGKASIRKKLVISYLILVLLPLIVLGVYSYNNAKKNLLSQTRSTIQSNVDSISYNIRDNIQREEDNLKYLSYNTSFREKLESAENNMTALIKELNNSVEPVFWYFITSDRNIKGLQVYSSRIKTEVGSFLKPDENYRDEEWYEYHQTEFKPMWTVEKGKMCATRTILDAATSSKPIGIMKLEVYPDNVLDSLTSVRYLENGMILKDRNNQVIVSRALKNQELENEIRKEIETLDDSGMYETDRYILAAEEAFHNGWRLFYYVDKEEIAGDVNKIFQTTLLVVGFCLLIITILISVISKILSSRILKLKNCAEQVGKGNFQIVTETGYTDEIGIVANSLSVMSRKIDEMMDEVYRMGLEKRATELKALQAMINPHFLYNCLSSIKWKAIRAEQDAIADITGLLAKFYRTVLNEGKQITIVRNELENVRAYLEIQRRTHENPIEIIYKIPDKGLDYEMPNFLLQPIVENAVCHGIDYCPEEQKGMICVEYVPGEKFLEFNIYNNGPHLEEEKLRRILKEPGKGYGIYNIQERIGIYYNEECGVSVCVTEDGLVCFTVRILKQILNTL